MIVLKFGGTSVGTPERVRQVAGIVGRAREREPVVVVVSAHAGVTDLLIELGAEARRGRVDLSRLEERHHAMVDGLGLPRELVHHELRQARTLLRGVALLRELTPRSRDHLLSFGERLSARIVAACFEREGVPADAVMAWDAGMVTDDRFGRARPVPGALEAIAAALPVEGERVPIITGHIGRTPDGEVTTMGRGGSDYSAAVLGAALGAREIQIWTDVDGVLSADPRIVPDARILEAISFDEAAELAFFGAKVLHPETIQPAVERGIPIRVLNTLRPEAAGTLITGGAEPSAEVVKSIALRRGVRVLNVISLRMLGTHGFIRRLGEAFDRHGVPIDMMATSEVSVSLTVDEDLDIDELARELRHFATVVDLPGCAIACVVGEGLRDTPGVAARVLQALGREGVNILMISQGASRLNLGLVVGHLDAERAVRTLHEELFRG